MQPPVVVIVGAGASFASGNYAESDRPPMTRQLFDRGPSLELLKRYTLAQAAGRAIERDMRTDSTMAFEEALSRLQNDGYAHHRQMALAIPPFLQALLLKYSEALRAESSRYGVLVDQLLKLRTRVHFVNVNYDTLLDNQLGAYSPLRVLDDYIDTPLAWTLIKPHGSVNWYVELDSVFDPTAPAGDLHIRDQPIECVPASTLELRRVRGRGADANVHGMTRRYPAIALPDGPKDKLVLPIAHLRHFRGVLADASEIDLLVIGYSALDTEILELVRGGGPRIRRLTIVNGDPAAALEVFDRIKAFGLQPVWPDVFDGSFQQWIDGHGLRTWVAEYEGPFRSIIEPEALGRRLNERARQRAARRGRAEQKNLLTRPM